ncbi:protein-cysteine N-palmitoyltransferase HHAT [Protopterus annectens]|uniref:protein-cysteine N-palmitoyltransferase HHAT n=1 Tax=Protopterus annectens TaxID=7888 RepID=UPI001CFAB8A1|nr:protein-cysteine N-palmitoyltransferase HHAT [Protopterus annectens]
MEKLKTLEPSVDAVALPRWEIFVYLALSFGSHLYSFYEVHQVSRAYERALHSKGELEDGFTFWGYKKDPTDFEWSFWIEWGRQSVLWTLLGHVVVSQLVRATLPKFRIWFLTGYGLLACWLVLGLGGLAIILLHVVVSFAVAQFRLPFLCWLCSLLLLYSLHIPSLEEVQKKWYSTEDEYYLLLFSLAVSCLRCISFCLENCWQQSYPKCSQAFMWMLAYLFYYPGFHNGPVLNFNEFSTQMQKKEQRVKKNDIATLMLGIARIFLWWWLAESMIHFMYMHAIHNNEAILESVTFWTLGGLALAQVLFFYVKYLVLFGIPTMIIRLDGIEPPKLPRCVSAMYSFTGLWRNFDVGLHRWLIRYIYIPLGGSQHGLPGMMFSTAMAFGFVFYWHGGHGYLFIWAVLNWLGIIVENGVKRVLFIPSVWNIIERSMSPRMRRRAYAALASFSTAMLILSNLVFLGGIDVGKFYWNRIFVQGWPWATFTALGFLYCYAQIGMEFDRAYR